MGGRSSKGSSRRLSLPRLKILWSRTASTTTAKASAAKRNADGSLPDITKL